MKHTFNRLARGVKLQVGHIYTAVTSSLDNLTVKAGTSDGVVVNQMAAPDGPFTVHLSVPNFDATQEATSIPFVLPAYQGDSIWTSSYSGEETQVFRIEDMGFYFDSHDEAAAIGGVTGAVPNQAVFEGISDYKLEVTILETRQTVNGETNATQSRYSSVWAATIPATAWEAGLNPQTFSEISAELAPMRTYVVRVVAPDLDNVLANKYALPNLNVWMKLSTKLAPRDIHKPSNSEYVQNIPTPANGEVNNVAVTVTDPAPGNLISAEMDTSGGAAYDGIQTALGKVDKIFRDKLRGGYNIHSELPPAENLTDGSAYKVIAVPMWGNFPGDVSGSISGSLPYVGSLPFISMVTDRRVIPISNNFTVHHVIACANYGTSDAYPSTATFAHHVGVGIGSGLRSDLNAYQQVAYNTWRPYNAGTHEIDKCSVTLNDSLNDSWEIVSVPLVEITGEESQNYGQQGAPFFIGQARSQAVARTNVGAYGGGSGGAPATDGQESFIEVRWGLKDTAGLENLAGEVIVPHYGNWVYIIGKTTLVTANQE
jgi:hypothetical protein